MIEISGKLPTYRLCAVCRSDDEVREITFSYSDGVFSTFSDSDGVFSQGIQIALCKECRRELMKQLETEEEGD